MHPASVSSCLTATRNEVFATVSVPSGRGNPPGREEEGVRVRAAEPAFPGRKEKCVPPRRGCIHIGESGAGRAGRQCGTFP